MAITNVKFQNFNNIGKWRGSPVHSPDSIEFYENGSKLREILFCPLMFSL